MYDTTEALIEQIQIGEDSSFELKDLRYSGDKVLSPNADSLADELAAMANSGNGVVVLGVDDRSKAVIGIPKEKLDIVETWVRNICNDLIKPQLFCGIRKVRVMGWDGSEKVVVRIDVAKSLFVHKSPGGYFLRIGSSKRMMEPEVLARLFQQRSQSRIIRFDEQAVENAPVGCLDKVIWQRFRTTLSPVDDNDFLLKLKLLTKGESGVLCPSVSGLLMACVHPEEYLSNAFIQAVAYRGEERNADYQLDAKDIKGTLNSQIVEACRFVERNMKVAARKSIGREDIPQYDMTAVFEAIVNAVAHRDYSIYGSKIRLQMFSDRLELFSPGAIPNTMTVDSMPLRQSSRNELVSSLLAMCPVELDAYGGHRKFIMDKRGEGVPLIINKSEALSGKRPVYHLIDDAELQLTIYAANVKDREE